MAFLNITTLYETSLCRAVCTSVLGETDGQRRLADLGFKEVLLVQEEDDGGFLKPLVVTDGIEQLERLVHAVLEERD